MAAETKVPIRQEKLAPSSTLQAWQPFEGLRQEIDRLFDDIGWGTLQPFRRSLFPGEPVFRRALTRATMPAVDVAESEKSYEIKAELPGMDEKDIEVKVTDGSLTIKGEKQEEKERRRRGIITCRSGATVHSNAASNCQRVLTRTRSRPALRRAC